MTDVLDALKLDKENLQKFQAYAEAHPDEPATLAQIAAIRRDHLDILEMVKHLVDFTKDMNERNVERNTRIQALEETALRDADVWKEGNAYRKADVVTHQGALWSCKANTTDRPPSAAWRLMFKTHGKDLR